MWWLSWSALAADPCSEVTLETTRAGLARAESALEETSAALSLAVTEVRAQAACLVQVLPAADIGRLHLLVGFDHLAAGRDPEASAAFQAAIRAAPALAHDRWSSLDAAEPARRLLDEAFKGAALERYDGALPDPRRGDVLVDGLPLDARPARSPSFVQWIDDKEVRGSAYLSPTDDPPQWPEAGDGTAALLAVEVPALALTATGVALLILAQARYASACPDAECPDIETFNTAFVGPQRTALVLTGLGAGASAAALTVHLARPKDND